MEGPIDQASIYLLPLGISQNEGDAIHVCLFKKYLFICVFREGESKSQDFGLEVLVE